MPGKSPSPTPDGIIGMFHFTEGGITNNGTAH